MAILFQIGALVQHECLLTCHGDEMGMLEDMSTGVDDLAHVTFKVKEGVNEDDVMPTVRGNRCKLA